LGAPALSGPVAAGEWSGLLASIRLDDGEMLRVYGPARVRVRAGTLLLLGAELTEGFEAFIPAGRSYTVKARGGALFDLEIEGEARVERPSPEEEPLDDWLAVADAILDRCDLPCRVAVLGPVEAGKTSFTALMANRALARGLLPGVVDADVGQADIGPPAFVSMAIASDWVVWLRDLEPHASRFVGSIEPGPASGRIITGVSGLVREALAEGAGIVVVDTDGWVQGWPAIEYKGDLLRAARIDYAVVLGSSELAETVERMMPGRVYYARSPREKAVRSVEDRRNLRSANYRRFLEGAQEKVVDVSRVEVYGSCVFSSRRVADERLIADLSSTLAVEVVYVGSFPGGYCVVVDSEEPVDLQSLRGLQKRLQGDLIVVHTGGFRGVLVGVSGGDANEWPGMVEWVDLEKGLVGLRTGYSGEVRRVVFGRIRLVDGYQESAGRKRIWI